jgi:tetratricopeptide (TPR) repeat protein
MTPTVVDAGEAENAPILVDPNNLDSLYLAAQQEFLQGNFPRAAELYSTILLTEQGEKRARAWHALGDVNMATLRFDAAADAFREALKLEPGKRMSLTRLGRALQRGGRFAEAIQVYRQLQELAPEDASAYRFEAEVLVPLQRIDEAIERLERAVAVEKVAAQKAQDYALMGEFEVKRQGFERAARFFEQAIAAEPTTDRHVALAEAELRAGRLDKARDAFRAAALLEALDPFYWEAVAELELRLGDRASARQAFLKSLEVAPRALIHVALGRLELSEGGKEAEAAAKARLSEALAVTEGEAQDIREAAHLAARLKDWEVAEKLLLTLTDGEDTEDKDQLWREIAAIREVRAQEGGVAEACARAKQAFDAALPLPDPKSVPPACSVVPTEVEPPMPDMRLASEEMLKCSEAMASAQQGKLTPPEVAQACQKAQEYQQQIAQMTALAQLRQEQAQADAATPERTAPPPRPLPACPPASKVTRPTPPACPPSADDMPWQR